MQRCCRISRSLKLLGGIGGFEIQKGMAGMDFLDKHVQQISFRQDASHLENMGSWKAGSPASNPRRLKAESRQFVVDLKQSLCKTTEITINITVIQILDTTTLCFWMHDASILQRVERAAALGDLLLFGRESQTILHYFVAFDTWKHGVDFCKMLQQMAFEIHKLKKSNRNFTVTGMSMSCLDRARTAIQILDTTTLFFACMMQAYCRESSVLLLSGTSSSLVWESRQFFITSWLLLHGNIGSIFARCYNKWPLSHKPKNLIEHVTVTGMSMSCLGRSRTANFRVQKI